MTYSNSAQFANPFGCPFPGCTPNFNPAFNGGPGNFHPSFAQAPTQWNNFAPAPFAQNHAPSPSYFGWNTTPWFNSPTPHNTFNSNHAAWYNSFAPNNWANSTPNNWFSPNSAWPQNAWPTSSFESNAYNQHAPNFAPSNPWSWSASPSFHQPFTPNYETSTPWFGPAFGGQNWFAPHNWTNPQAYSAWTPPANPAQNGTHPTPSPYDVATPANNANPARDAA